MAAGSSRTKAGPGAGTASSGRGNGFPPARAGRPGGGIFTIMTMVTTDSSGCLRSTIRG